MMLKLKISEETKNIIIAVLTILLIAAIIILIITGNNNKKEDLTRITGTVIVADKDYLIINDGYSDYVVSNMKGAYNEGDLVNFTYDKKDLNNEVNPKVISVKDEELVKAYIEDKIDNSNDDKLSKIDTDDSDASSKIDATVLGYFDELKEDVDATDVKSSVKKGFISVVDFLFYKGKIKGYTFSQLSNSAKLKVLSMALYFDTKIDKYFPGYKESIKTKGSRVYTEVKKQVITTYLTITTAICANNDKLCSSAKKGFNEIKDKFGVTWDLIKDVAGDGLTNLKSWYEIWSGK